MTGNGNGQFGGFILTLLLATLALIGIGKCIASFATTTRVTQVIGALCVYPPMFFSGLWLPIPQVTRSCRTSATRPRSARR
jgi:ABC-2 type transport system permease protein